MAPFLSIMTNLYKAVNTVTAQNPSKYDSISDVFGKTDSFDPDLFKKLNSLVLSELPP